MKRSIYLMAVAIFASTVSFAQPADRKDDAPQAPKEMPTVEQMAEMKAQRMKRQLLLGSDQYDKVYKLCLKQAEAERKRMEQMKQEREEMAKQMKGILNDAQYERFEQLQNRHGMPPADAMHRHHGQMPPADGMKPVNPAMGKGPQIMRRSDRTNNMFDDTKERNDRKPDASGAE